MPKIVHVVTTRSFAGVERHVVDVASETAGRGWEVSVIGGAPASMRRELDPAVRWERGGSPLEALRSLARVGRADVCHAHMTVAETVALVGRPLHRAPVVVTRHFAAARGATRLGGALAPWIARNVSRELAVSDFVARSIERPPAAVVPGGARPGPLLWRSGSRVVLVLQRLEPEKDTLTALRAWKAADLVDEGWSLRVVGSGSEQELLERWVAAEGVRGVTFAGWAEDVAAELAGAGMLLAPGPRDSFGLTVVEAMIAGVPVVAAAAGGHLETVGLVAGAPLFAAGDPDDAARALRAAAVGGALPSLSARGRELALARLGVAAHVDALLLEYGQA